MTADTKRASRSERCRNWLLGLVVLFMSGAVLRATYFVAMPLVFAFFIALLLHPLQAWLNRKCGSLPFLPLLVTMGVLVAVLLLGVFAIGLGVQLLAEALPSAVDTVETIWEEALRLGQEHGVPVGSDPLKGKTDFQDAVLDALKTGVLSTWSILAAATLIFFYTLLMLVECELWAEKARNAFSENGSREILVTVRTIASKIRRYLVMRTLVSLTTGAVCGLWVWLCDVRFPLLWAGVFFLFNYVPNLGSAVAIIPPTLLAMMDLGISYGLVVLGGLAVIQNAIGYGIEPRLQGHTLRLSAIVILASLIFWSWMWGVAGALLAVPTTATIVVIFGHIEELRPISVFLSERSSGKVRRLTEQ